MITVNAKNAFALLPDVAWLKSVISAEKEVKVKKFDDSFEAFNYAAKEYEAYNFLPGGDLLWLPTLEQMQLNPWFRDGFHDNEPAGGIRVFVVISEAAGMASVGIFTHLDTLGAVFLDAPVGTEAWEVPDVPAAVGQIQRFVAKTVLPYSGYFPVDEFQMLKALPLNKMVLLPYGVWMQTVCFLPPGLQPYSLFGYAKPVLNPGGPPKPLLPASATDSVEAKGGENDE